MDNYTDQIIDILIPQKKDDIYYGDKKDENRYTLKDSVFEGGEGIIYPCTGGKLLKIYKSGQLTLGRIKKLEYIINAKKNLGPFICWPETLLYETSAHGNVIGFAMKDVTADDEETVTLEKFINNIGALEEKWNINRKELVRLCIKIVNLFSILHKNEILMGDVNPKNILVSSQLEVYFIDTDSYQIDTFLNPVGMPEFTSARIYRKGGNFLNVRRTLEDEYFAIACLIFRILFLGDSPFPSNHFTASDNIKNHRFRFDDRTGSQSDKNYIWLNLTPKMRKAFYDNFVNEVYTDDATWDKMLEEMYTHIHQHHLSNNLMPCDYVEERDLGIKTFTTALCKECGKEFEVHKATRNDNLCSVCLGIRYDNRKSIYRIKCNKCGKKYTVNPWDSRNLDTDTCLCPDCDNSLSFPQAKDFSEEKIKEYYDTALKNMKGTHKEDII